MVKKSNIILILKIILGLVFIFSGTTKLIDTNGFAEALANFKLLNDNLIDIIKYIIPVVEVLLGTIIIFNFSSGLPALISSLLLSFFTALIVAKLFEGEEINCGCFGVFSSPKLDIFAVVRNILLILISIIVSSYYENKRAEENMLKDKVFDKILIKSLKIILVTNLIFFLASQNLIFALQNNGLKSRLSLLINDYDILKKNEIVKPVEVFNLENKKVYINYNSNLNKNTLIFLLKPTCSPCKLNLPNWIKLFNLADTSQIRILPVSIGELENTAKYVYDNLIPFNVYFTNSDEFLLNYKAFLTPQTILIDRVGKVINLWKGILDEKSINEILQNNEGG